MTEPKSLILDVEEAIKGNQKSFTAIYDYLAPILRGAIKRKIYGVQSPVVQDTLQDIFVKIFNKIHTFKPGNSFKNWALSIALHHVIDLSRRRKVDIILCDVKDSRYSERLADTSYSQSVPYADIYMLVISHLDKVDRRVILDKYFLSLKQKQIAVRMKKPIGSISGIQAKAVGQLRTKVQELRLERVDFI